MDFDSKGLFSFLGTRRRTRAWSNPHESGDVTVSASGLGSDCAPVSALVGQALVRFVTPSLPNQWIAFSLRDVQLLPTHYSLRHYSSWDAEALRNWCLEGSTNGVDWVVLRRHENDQALTHAGASHTWALTEIDRPYAYFRIRQTGRNSNQNLFLALSCAEFYGVVTDREEPVIDVYSSLTSRKLSDLASNPGPGFSLSSEGKRNISTSSDESRAGVGAERGGSPPALLHAPLPNPHLKEFKWSYDLDPNGVLYYLATAGYQQPYQNPAVLGKVSTSSSSLSADSAPIHAWVGRGLTRCATATSEANPFFAVDLKSLCVVPSAYTLRHADYCGSDAMRSWRLLGSADGVAWTVLREHEQDDTLQVKGQACTWPLENGHAGYRVFKVMLTGPNAGHRWVLALSSFELYGVVKVL